MSSYGKIPAGKKKNQPRNTFEVAIGIFNKHEEERKKENVKHVKEIKDRIRAMSYGYNQSKVDALEKAVDELASAPREGQRSKEVTRMAKDLLENDVIRMDSSRDGRETLEAALKRACETGDTEELVKLTKNPSLAVIAEYRKAARL